MHRLSTILVLLVGLAGACGPEQEEALVGQNESAIVNGEADLTHPEVGIVLGAQSCTGTLIGRRTVLTAAHCVAGAPLSKVAFLLGGKDGTRLAAREVVLHPSYQGGNRGDLALLRLEGEPAVAPARLAARAPVAGEEVELVGFGVPLEGSTAFGERRRARNRVSAVAVETFELRGADAGHGNLCHGDSGGPTFASGRDGDRVLVGVHSTKSGLCGQLGTDMRIDGALDWIRAEAEDLIEGEDGPQLRIASPAPSAIVGRRVRVELEASRELGQVELEVAGCRRLATSDGAGRFAVELELPEGTVQVQAIALDGAGREILRSAIEIRVDARAEAAGCSLAASGASAPEPCAVLLLLLALALHRRRAR